VRLRLYIDEDAMDSDLVDALRARGADLQTAHEAGMVGREDHEQLRHSTIQGRVMYTFNTGHFCALHASFLNRVEVHAGIVVSPQQRYTIGEQMRRLLNLIAAETAETMRNRLEFLTDWSESIGG
jgi:Domain of unknown function (DUF5615)